VKVYLADTDNEATLNVGADMRKIDQCYRAFKVRESKFYSNHRNNDICLDRNYILN
jgi:hypothetical protein